MKDKPLPTWLFLLIAVALWLIVFLVLAGKIAEGTPEWEPGDPSISYWENIELRVFWPFANTGRENYWECLVKVQHLGSGGRWTLTLRKTTSPEREHINLHTLFAFSSRPGVWKATDGSCVSRKDNSTHYVKSILNEGLPLNQNPVYKTIAPGYQVFVPALSGQSPLLLEHE